MRAAKLHPYGWIKMQHMSMGPDMRRRLTGSADGVLDVIPCRHQDAREYVLVVDEDAEVKQKDINHMATVLAMRRVRGPVAILRGSPEKGRPTTLTPEDEVYLVDLVDFLQGRKKG